MRDRSVEPESSAGSQGAPDACDKAKLIDELRQDLAAIERYEALHGSFPELVRRYSSSDDGI